MNFYLPIFGAKKNQDFFQSEFMDKNKNFRVECIILPLFINSKKNFFLFVREIDASFLNKSELIEEVIVIQRVSNMFWGVAFDMKCFTEIHERTKECLWDANNILYFFLWRSNQVK